MHSVARPLDISIVIPPALRPLFEGRREVSLGMPAGSGVVDVIATLLALYPRLQGKLASDREPRRHVVLALEEAATRELARGGGGLESGGRLYLFDLGGSAELADQADVEG
ncbi:MAG TPA: hypothetical protein VFO83_10620 [Aggregicoccus sp.]|nr:hypothetical protein [Aggregicoccus sp.]